MFLWRYVFARSLWGEVSYRLISSSWVKVCELTHVCWRRTPFFLVKHCQRVVKIMSTVPRTSSHSTEKKRIFLAQNLFNQAKSDAIKPLHANESSSKQIIRHRDLIFYRVTTFRSAEMTRGILSTPIKSPWSDWWSMKISSTWRSCDSEMEHEALRRPHRFHFPFPSIFSARRPSEHETSTSLRLRLKHTRNEHKAQCSHLCRNIFYLWFQHKIIHFGCRCFFFRFSGQIWVNMCCDGDKSEWASEKTLRLCGA